MPRRHFAASLVLSVVVAAALSAPAPGAVVLYSSPNTAVYLGLPFNDLEFENPLLGNEFVLSHPVIEWLDADYDPGPPKWYDDWTPTDPSMTDGNPDQIWMRTEAISIVTQTTMPSSLVSIHLVGDSNDGIAKVLVDGSVVARIDMGTAPPNSETALILVGGLPNTTHQIEVAGDGSGQYGIDVATLGAAALDRSQVKWSQPPDPGDPGNCYYGWNEFSVYENQQIVADDWVCETQDPVTDIHWWGSFLGWKQTRVPQMPDAFVITFWTDVPANVDEPFSHPGDAVHQIYCTNFTTEFVGWDYDPRTKEYEACFRFDQILTEEEYFHQEEYGIGHIWWISIAAVYQEMPQYPWGWKTRPRDPLSPAPDDAVIIWDPVAPVVGSSYVAGAPIWWPTEDESWDMAFGLTAIDQTGGIKWEQLPNVEYPGLHAHDWMGDPGDYNWITLADDWKCSGGEVTDFHWWGNYELDAAGGGEMRGSGINHFHLSIHKDEAGLPGPEVWGADVYTFTETDTGLVNNEGCRIYRYDFYLAQPYPQIEGEIYWFDVTAYANDPNDPPHWRWQEHGRSPLPLVKLNPAVKSQNGPPWSYIQWANDTYSEMAFVVTSGVPPVKWDQPPVYEPELNAFYGWDEKSEWEGGQIVADDWQCVDQRPITAIHWWGSYVNWLEMQPPADAPNVWHIGIWTDVPAGGTEPFSHPGDMIHEWIVTRDELQETFVGYDDHPDHGRDACFRYDFVIHNQEEWFYQPGDDEILWISISARYAAPVTDHPWGWKTRPHFFNDDAVRIFDPTAPFVGSAYVQGEPIEDRDGNSWDMAFRLTTTEQEPEPYVKWSQPPQLYEPDDVWNGWNEWSVYGSNSIAADDWYCDTDLPVTDIHWWGSFIGWNNVEPPVMPDEFHICIWSDVPAGADEPYSHPGRVLWETYCRNYTYDMAGWDFDPRNTVNPWETCYRFHYDIPPEKWFHQQPGDNIYWLSITAMYHGWVPDYYWGWKTRPRDSSSLAPDDAVRIFNPTAPGIGDAWVAGEPIFWPTQQDSWDLAFVLTTADIPQPGTLWFEPHHYIPDHFWYPTSDPDNEMVSFLVGATGEDIYWNSLTVQASGSGNDAADILAVNVWQDSDDDGKVTAGDVLLGTGTYPVDNGTVTIALAPAPLIPDGASKPVVISYTMANTAPPGATYTFSVIGASGTGAASGLPANITGLPVNACTKTAAPQPITIGQAKRMAMGVPRLLENKVVTADFLTSMNLFYIEEEDRSAGIGVDPSAFALPPTVAIGDRVTVLGTTALLPGGAELVLRLQSIIVTGSGDPLGSLGVNNLRSGGAQDWLDGENQPSVYDDCTVLPPEQAYGLSNVGMLLRIWGEVTSTGSITGYPASVIWLDDGSDLHDGFLTATGGPTEGVAVLMPAPIFPPPVGSYWAATGIMRAIPNPNGLPVRLFVPRDMADMTEFVVP